MDCHLFHMLIQRYYDGELDAVERSAYENHRRSCDACRLLDGRYAAVFGALDGIERIEPSAGFNAAVMSRVDVSRYRVGAVRKATGAVGRGWYRIPFPVRVGVAVSAIFALFVTAYGPFMEFFATLGGRFVSLVGDSLIAVGELAVRSETLLKSLSSATNYRLAGEVLMKTLQRWVAGLPLSHILIAAIVVIGALILTVRAARTVWSKGETHVSLF